MDDRGAETVTIVAHHRTDVEQFAGIVADIARALESPHEAEARITHVLGLVRRLVPCDRCALCTRPGSRQCVLAVVPDVQGQDRVQLTEFMYGVLEFMDGQEGRSRTFDSRAHLALPVIGLDEILGVLRVDREDGEEYEPYHLRSLSAVCSQLGAYLTMVRLHHESAQQTTTLAEREKQLREAARFREEFIGVIGHDLRNPLSAIQTGTRLLMNRSGLDHADLAIVERIATSTNRMSRMIGELMDFARGRLGGGIPLRRTFVDLQGLCRDVVDEVQIAHGRSVHLEVSGTPRGNWDRDRLSQLISNLVGNALHHGRPGSIVNVRVRDERDHAVLEVHNEGAPIHHEHLEHIFEPFHHRKKTTSPGLGLGLYIVERIVTAHGGRLDVRSTAEEGTTFSVHLPHRRVGDRDGVDRSL